MLVPVAFHGDAEYTTAPPPIVRRGGLEAACGGQEQTVHWRASIDAATSSPWFGPRSALPIRREYPSSSSDPALPTIEPNTGLVMSGMTIPYRHGLIGPRIPCQWMCAVAEGIRRSEHPLSCLRADNFGRAG